MENNVYNPRRVTPFGKEIKTFIANTGLTIKEIAENSGVSVSFLRDVMRDRSVGHELKPKVYQFIQEYQSKNSIDIAR